MGTGENLTASAKVQRLQTALHAKAKEAPGLRFYSLNDKVWREDVLAVAWQVVRRNGGAAGVGKHQKVWESCGFVRPLAPAPALLPGWHDILQVSLRWEGIHLCVV